MINRPNGMWRVSYTYCCCYLDGNLGFNWNMDGGVLYLAHKKSVVIAVIYLLAGWLAGWLPFAHVMRREMKPSWRQQHTLWHICTYQTKCIHTRTHGHQRWNPKITAIASYSWVKKVLRERVITWRSKEATAIITAISRGYSQKILAFAHSSIIL